MKKTNKPRMAKVILLCGKICVGKTTYAKKLASDINAVYLSLDDLMLKLFPEPLGDKYDKYFELALNYLSEIVVDIVKSGVETILDIGGWKRTTRQKMGSFFKEKSVHFEWHYIDVTDDIWHEFLKKRNNAIDNGKSDAYYVDDGLAKKCLAQFEAPSLDEVDVYALNGKKVK